MARIRNVRPTLRTSRLVASWPFDMRYFWVLLWGYLDDEGRGLDLPKQIAGDCFPHDESMPPSKIDKYLDRMSQGLSQQSGPVCRYQVDGVRYLHAVHWDDNNSINRPTPSRLPPCPLHEGLTDPNSEGDSDSITESTSGDSRLGKEEERKRGKGEESLARARAMFPAFYAAYPRKRAPKDAEKAWLKAIKNGADPQVVIDAAKRFAAVRAGQDPTFTPYPATWLNRGEWASEDEPTQLRVVGGYQPFQSNRDPDAWKEGL
jgi:hypothetical protein